MDDAIVKIHHAVALAVLGIAEEKDRLPAHFHFEHGGSIVAARKVQRIHILKGAKDRDFCAREGKAHAAVDFAVEGCAPRIADLVLHDPAVVWPEVADVAVRNVVIEGFDRDGVLIEICKVPQNAHVVDVHMCDEPARDDRFFVVFRLVGDENLVDVGCVLVGAVSAVHYEEFAVGQLHDVGHAAVGFCRLTIHVDLPECGLAEPFILDRGFGGVEVIRATDVDAQSALARKIGHVGREFLVRKKRVEVVPHFVGRFFHAPVVFELFDVSVIVFDCAIFVVKDLCAVDHRIVVIVIALRAVVTTDELPRRWQSKIQFFHRSAPLIRAINFFDHAAVADHNAKAVLLGLAQKGRISVFPAGAGEIVASRLAASNRRHEIALVFNPEIKVVIMPFDNMILVVVMPVAPLGFRLRCGIAKNGWKIRRDRDAFPLLRRAGIIEFLERLTRRKRSCADRG